MPTKVIMPQLGESVDEATVMKWLKARGERVEEYEPLLEVNTDKVDTEIPSPASGTLLEIVIPEGETIRAGTLLAWIGKAGETVIGADTTVETEAEPAISGPESQALAADRPVEVPSAKPTPPAPGRDHDLGFISPVVARIASEHQVDLYQISGTGLNGRITKKDILAHIQSRAGATQPITAPTVQPVSAPEPAGSQATTPLPASPTPASEVLPGEIIQLNPVRRAIAERMVFSKHTSPHVTTVMEADLSRVVAHRQANKPVFERDGARLTFMPYFAMAAVAALKAHPIVNSSWTEAGIELHRQINLGMATSLGEAGLIVPVIKEADGYSLLGLTRLVNDLADRARRRQLRPDEVKGGTFTITNHGTSGSLFATPIINQPQCAILGVGIIQKRVVVVQDANGNDSIAIRPMVYLSLTFDHRILDGAIADNFLSTVVEYLQNWD